MKNIDSKGHVTGRSIYLDDIPLVQGTLHGVVFDSPVAHGVIEILDFSIFNRWGAVVYDNEDPSNGWNGNYKGNPAPSAVYIYVIKLRLPDGTEEILKGDVTLLR